MPDFDVPVVSNEEELLALLDAQGAGEKENESASSSKEGDDPGDEGNDNPDGGKPEEGKDKPGGAAESKDKPASEEETYDNVISFLNKKHNLGLNIAEIPPDLTREDEAEAVSDLFERVVTNAQAQLQQFADLQTLLEDDEIAMLLKAKAEGKGLKELFSTYVTTVDGKTDEQVVFDDFKKKYPKLSEENINNMVAAQKEKGKFAEIATAIREQVKDDDTASEQQRLVREEAERKQAIETRKVEDANFAKIVKGVKKINDVAFTEDMQAEVLTFALERDRDGFSRLDHVLQSDAGVLRATLGIVLLDRLMGAKSTVSTNREKKSLMDKLFTKPSESTAGTGGGGGGREKTEITDDMYNLF